MKKLLLALSIFIGLSTAQATSIVVYKCYLDMPDAPFNYTTSYGIPAYLGEEYALWHCSTYMPPQWGETYYCSMEGPGYNHDQVDVRYYLTEIFDDIGEWGIAGPYRTTHYCE